MHQFVIRFSFIDFHSFLFHFLASLEKFLRVSCFLHFVRRIRYIQKFQVIAIISNKRKAFAQWLEKKYNKYWGNKCVLCSLDVCGWLQLQQRLLAVQVANYTDAYSTVHYTLQTIMILKKEYIAMIVYNKRKSQRVSVSFVHVLFIAFKLQANAMRSKATSTKHIVLYASFHTRLLALLHFQLVQFEGWESCKSLKNCRSV